MSGENDTDTAEVPVFATEGRYIEKRYMLLFRDSRR